MFVHNLCEQVCVDDLCEHADVCVFVILSCVGLKG